MSGTAYCWEGRRDSTTDRSALRYHQVVNRERRQPSFVQLIGFESDEGVRRNCGRLGAKEAPNAIRRQLSSIPWKLRGVSIEDYGNLACIGTDLEGAQEQLGQAVANVLKEDGLVIVLGGGHETTYGHYLGVREALGPDAKLGIINIDAHFDMRPYDKQRSSGTMFLQIKEQDLHASYFVLGIQPFGNTIALYETAASHDVKVLEAEEVAVHNWTTIREQLRHFIDANDAVYLTLCTDVLNTAYAPGVSATTPFGIDPLITRKIVQLVMGDTKATSFDICEVNPSLDIDERTAKLGAYFVNEAIYAHFNA